MYLYNINTAEFYALHGLIERIPRHIATLNQHIIELHTNVHEIIIYELMIEKNEQA